MCKKEKVLWILNKVFMSYFVVVFIFINVVTINFFKYCLSHMPALANEPIGLLIPIAYDGFVLIHTIIFFIVKLLLKRKVDLVLFLPVIAFLFSLFFIFHYDLGFNISTVFQINLIGRSIFSLLSLVSLFFILKRRPKSQIEKSKQT